MARRTRKYYDSQKYFEWLEFASEDLLAAKLLKADEYCANVAAFHCQQSIEKALKAYLLFVEFPSPDGHNLTWLCKKARTYDNRFAQWLDESAFLNKYYIETRYPGDIPLDVSEEMLERIYNIAYQMYKFICKLVYNNENLDINDD